MDTILVNLAGVALILLIVWWFWLSKPKAQKAGNDVIEILVDNGTYTPSRIEVPAGKKTRLRFFRKDASPCAEKVVFERFNISADLPLNQAKEIEVTPDEPGEYRFTCQMQMYKGSIVAK
ncbi:cupredoxin domain-containing protein [Kaarinaea lacus]